MTTRNLRIANSRRLLVLLVGAVVTMPMAAAAQLQEQALTDLAAVRDALVDAAVDVQFFRFDEGAATVGAAMETVDAVKAAVEADGGASLPGGNPKKATKALAKVQRKAKRVASLLAGKGKIEKKLAGLRAVSKHVTKAMEPIGAPLVGAAELALSGTFFEPDADVSLRLQQLDGSPCVEQPVVELVNEGFGHAVDPETLAVDGASSAIRFTMGPDTGVGRLSVAACGRSAISRLFNFGPPTPKDLPSGFPTNLPDGDYRLIISLCQRGSCDPERVVAILDASSAQAFADDINNRIVIQVSPEEVICRRKWQFTPFDGSSFLAIMNLTCTYQGQTVLTARVLVRLELVT